MKTILVAHDGSKSADKALRKAVEFAVTFKSSITVLSVVPDLYLPLISQEERSRIITAISGETGNVLEKIEKTLAGNKALGDKSTVIKTLMKQGDPAEKILETAAKLKADLLVTGSHGKHGGRRFMLGSVSSKVAEHAKCSVLVVK